MPRLRTLKKAARWTLRLLLFALVIDLIYVASIWPDWARLRAGPIPRSEFMQQYAAARVTHRWPQTRWRPVRLKQIPRHTVRAVLIAEDSRFYTHGGFDFTAIREAWDYNLSAGRIAFGASTISQQTAKNLFLSPARTPLRKWHELIFTFALERNLSKQRILELYLNVAEFGRGIYGVDAAARAYWGVPVSALTIEQSAQLAATLPGPVKHNPHTRTRYFERRSKKILSWLGREFDTRPAWTVPTPAPDGPGVPPALDRDVANGSDAI